MRRERITLVGTPTVIAPGAIPLLGDFALPGEELAVLAALSSHATAQYIPDEASNSPLLSAVTELTRAYLGETAAALPPGAVLLRPPAAREDGQEVHFDTAPANAVAATAAVFETVGQAIGNRRGEILQVASAAHHTTCGGVQSDAELAAALHGGLIKSVCKANTAPRIESLAAPAALHLVVFKTARVPLPAGWVASVRKFAERSPRAYATIIDDVREHADRFVAELSDGNATAAIASAGHYGRCILQLATAASVPFLCEHFTRAMELAREIGGIAKPTGAGHGDLGIAMFATPEAASLFANACRPPLVPLVVGLDRSGVRCLVLDESGESAVIYTPVPEIGSSSISTKAIVLTSVDDKTTERRLSEPGPDCLPTPQPIVTQGEEPPPVSAPIIIEEASSPELSAAHQERPRFPQRSRTWLIPTVAGALIASVVLVAWLTNALGHHGTPPVTTEHRRGTHIDPLPGRASPEPAPAEVEPVPTPSEAPPRTPSSAAEPPLSRPHGNGRRAHRSTSGEGNDKRPGAAQGASPPRPTAPAAREAQTKAPALRAGKLSADDF